MQFDFKTTIWERVTVDDDIEKEVCNNIKSGLITKSDQIFDMYRDGTVEMETLLDTSVQISLKDNDGHATIEIISDDAEKCWNNSL